MIRARVFAICCGYEDADDLDDGERLWTDLRDWAYRGEPAVDGTGGPRRRADLPPYGSARATSEPRRAVDRSKAARAAMAITLFLPTKTSNEFRSIPDEEVKCDGNRAAAHPDLVP